MKNIRYIFGIICSMVFLIFVFLDVKTYNLEWKRYSREFKEKEVQRAVNKAQRKKILDQPIEIEQIEVAGLNIVDRCISCHRGVDDPTYGASEQPFSYHPNHEQHPFDKFGCTICHQGQGRALDKEAAHGTEENWKRPLLKKDFVVASCGRCHLLSDLKNISSLNQGREIFLKRGCQGCHKVDGVGGLIAPDLSKLDKRGRTDPDWLISHFKEPAKVSPGSVMPPMRMSDKELKALTIYTLSLAKIPLTEYFLSRKIFPDPESGKRIFQGRKCYSCHDLSKKPPMLSSPNKLKRYLKNPKEIIPNSKKPDFHLKKYEIDALVSFLVSASKGQIMKAMNSESKLSPVQRGRDVFRKYGCAGCHGVNGADGIKNKNAKTAEKVPALKFVKEGYTASQLKKKIREGVAVIQKMDPKGQTPPLTMPPWGKKISESELNDLVKYLFSLFPKNEELDW